MQVMTEKTMTSSVTEIFPCSSGADHCNKGLQETSVGTIGTPTPPQVSGLKCFTTTFSCYTCTGLGWGVFATSRLALSLQFWEVNVIYFNAASFQKFQFAPLDSIT